MSPNDTQALSIRLPRDLHEKLRRAAFDQRIPMNTIIIEAVAEKLAGGEQ